METAPLTVLRHMLAIAVLPFTVAIAVPVGIARNDGISFTLPDTAASLALQLLGGALLAIGLLLFLSSVRRFAVEGRGTLAPWRPDILP